MKVKAGRIVADSAREALPCEFALDPNLEVWDPTFQSHSARAQSSERRNGYSVSDSQVLIEGLYNHLRSQLPPQEIAENDVHPPADDARLCLDVLVKLARLGQQSSLLEDTKEQVLVGVVSQIGTRIDATLALPERSATARPVLPPAQ